MKMSPWRATVVTSGPSQRIPLSLSLSSRLIHDDDFIPLTPSWLTRFMNDRSYG